MGLLVLVVSGEQGKGGFGMGGQEQSAVGVKYLWREEAVSGLCLFLLYIVLSPRGLMMEDGDGLEEGRVKGNFVSHQQIQYLYQRHPQIELLFLPQNCQHYLQLLLSQIIGMLAEEKMKKQSEKLTKQSFALLARLKAKRQNPVVTVNEENYIEDLYVKVFKKCSPHFDKMETSNAILLYVQSQESERGKLKEDWQQLLKENAQIKAQLVKLKEVKDETIKIKMANAQLNRLEQENQDNFQQIKALKREKVELGKEIQALRKANQTANEVNLQLQSFLEKLTKELDQKEQKEEKNEALAKQAHQYQQEIDLLNIKIEELENERGILGEEGTSWANNYSLLQSEQRQTHSYLQVKQEEIEKKNKRISELQQLLSLERESSKRAVSSCERLQHRIVQLDELKKTIQQQLDSAVHANQQHSKQLQENQQHLQRILAERQEKEKQIIDLRTEISKISNDLSTHKSLLASSQQMNLKLTIQNQQLQRNLVKINNEASSAKQGLQGKIFELKERLKFFKENNEVLNNERVDLIANIELLAEETKNLASTLQAKENELEYERQARELAVKEAVAIKEGQMKIEWIGKQKDFEGKMKQKDNEGKEQQNQITILKNIISQLKVRLSQKQASKPENDEQIEMKDTMEIHNVKTSKHMETIGQLSAELTQAYRVIQQLQSTISKLKVQEKSSKEKKSSVQKKQRGRSIKKIAGMFGF